MTTCSKTDDGRNNVLLRWLPNLMFFTFAMTSDAVGSVIPRVIHEFHLNMTEAGAFHYVPMSAIAAGALCLGFLADRLGRQWTIIAGLLLYCGSSILFSVGSTYLFFVVLLIASGAGISVFKIGALALIGDLSSGPTAHTKLMNAAEGFFAVGSIVGPAIVAILLSFGLSWKWLYVIAAAICAVLIVIASLVRYPTLGAVAQRSGVSETLRLIKNPYVAGFSSLVILYVSVEASIYVWMPTYLLAYRGRYTWLPAYSLTVFFVLRAAGRFLGVWLLELFDWSTTLALCSFMIALCFLGSMVEGVDTAAWLLPASGLFMSMIYPTLNSKGISCFDPGKHGAVAGVILFFTAAAAALSPLAMAALADHFGNVKYGFALATALACLLFLGLAFNWWVKPAASRLKSLERIAGAPSSFRS